MVIPFRYCYHLQCAFPFVYSANVHLSRAEFLQTLSSLLYSQESHPLQISICLELSSYRPPPHLFVLPGIPSFDLCIFSPRAPPLCLHFTGHGRIFHHVLGFMESTSLKLASVSWGVPFLAVAMTNDMVFCFSSLPVSLPPSLLSPLPASLHRSCLLPSSLPPSGPHTPSLHSAAALLRGPCISDAHLVQCLQAPVPTQGASSTLP